MSHNDTKQPLSAGEDTTSSSAQHSILGQDSEKAQVAPNPYNDPAPDGGATAWLVVLGVWCASFCSFGWLSSVGVFQEYYQNELLRDYSASTISWIPSLQIFFMMGMGPIVGILYDHFGPRVLLLGGSLLHVFGIMMTSLGSDYYQILLAQGVCSGIGASAIFQPSLNSIHGWFDKNRAAAFGILSTGSSIGGIIFPVMVNRLIRQVGFGWAMRVSGFLLLFLLIVANLTVRARHPPHPQKVTAAQLIKPLTELEFVFLAAGFFFFTFGFFATMNYLPVQVLVAGMRPDLAQYVVSILNAGSLFGRLLAGFLGDKMGRYNVFVIVCYMTGILILALWLPASSEAALLVFAVLFGFFSGAYVSLIAPLVMQISPAKEIGFRTGIVFLVTSLSGLTTNPINGALLDASGGWTNLMIFSGVTCLLGTTLILAARIKRTGFKLFVAF